MVSRYHAGSLKAELHRQCQPRRSAAVYLDSKILPVPGTKWGPRVPSM